MRILVIEDEIRIQAFLARGLEAEGYAVAAADNGRDGVALATTGVGTLWCSTFSCRGSTACACSRRSAARARSCLS